MTTKDYKVMQSQHKEMANYHRHTKQNYREMQNDIVVVL